MKTIPIAATMPSAERTRRDSRPDFLVVAGVGAGEGPRMTAQIVCRPDEVKIGLKVKSVFRRIATDGESGIIHYGTKFVLVE